MLPAGARLRRRREFSDVFRGGRRASSPSVVVHLLVDGPQPGPRVGFAVGKLVGRAVDRNTVKRRLRHIARERLGQLPGDARLIVRALPGAAELSFHDLARDVDRAISGALRKAAGRAAR